jgi:hypothetical protein
MVWLRQEITASDPSPSSVVPSNHSAGGHATPVERIQEKLQTFPVRRRDEINDLDSLIVHLNGEST